MQNVARYLNGNRIVLVNDRQDTLINREYMQSLGYLLCTLGILGSLSTFWCFAKLFKQLKKHANLIIVFLLLLMLIANIITRQIFILWMIVVVTLAYNSYSLDQIKEKTFIGEHDDGRSCSFKLQ